MNTKHKITTRKNGSKRYTTILSDKKLTDQSMKNACDINQIIKKYVQTGLLPNVNKKPAQYLDLTEVPSFEKAHEIMQYAKELFYQLPSQVRSLMNHDPKNLESFISNPENVPLLEKYDLIKVKNKGDGQSKKPEAPVITDKTEGKTEEKV